LSSVLEHLPTDLPFEALWVFNEANVSNSGATSTLVSFIIEGVASGGKTSTTQIAFALILYSTLVARPIALCWFQMLFEPVHVFD
jgi:hypothetical protein